MSGYKLKLNNKTQSHKVDDILDEIIDLKIKEHYTNMSLLKYLKEKYGFCQSWCYDYLNAASHKIREIQEKNIENLLQEQQTKLLNDIEQMKKEGVDKKTILEYTKEYHKISGLYTERLNVSGDITIKAEFDNGLTPDTPKEEDINE
jgi:hypothetical protein